MHFEQPAPGFHALCLRLGRLRLSRLMPMPRMLHADASHTSCRCLAYLMLMPCMLDADALRYTVPMPAPTHADALRAAL